ncbi:hypothetical protein LY76DRAFT_647493 [Colletotrichum caudatum]|nr:hypothetical protein LY76DRAFT_647493 [Colletotrichum caudatum]
MGQLAAIAGTSLPLSPAGTYHDEEDDDTDNDTDNDYEQDDDYDHNGNSRGDGTLARSRSVRAPRSLMRQVG